MGLYQSLGGENFYFWFNKADETNYFIWKKPLYWPSKHWQTMAENTFYDLAAKYGPKIPGELCPYGQALKIRSRCYKAQKNFEKMKYYYGDN